MKYSIRSTIFILLFLCKLNSNAQCIGWTNMQSTDSVFTNPAFGIATTVEADRLHRPISYVSIVSGGIKIYDNNASGNPAVIASITKSQLGNLDAINLTQDSIWLYVCLGNIWDTTELAGLAIVDVSNFNSPVVLDIYIHPGLKGGAGAVEIEGNHAFLAANQNGLIILDISNKSDIQFTSSLLLNNNFPHSTGVDALKYNARGIAIKGNHAYVCYDRGGLRVIDISNLNSLQQISQYCTPDLINFATAYNNIVINDNIAFVAIDYYGLEILDISDPANIVQISRWQPSTWPAATNDPFLWAGSPGHCNELAYDSLCKIVYVASGKSDVVAIDVSTPAFPITCQMYGSSSDDYGTWGLDYFDNSIHLAYIWSPLAPPYSNYTGYKVIQTTCSTTAVSEHTSNPQISLVATSANGNYRVETKDQLLQTIEVFNMNGRLLQKHFMNEFSIELLANGLYFIRILTNNSSIVRKIVKQ
ncbi:MAG: T9SS type A sorting domain-containing protein [Bacteroidia bacterium]|nr:T9SS type A sorting domain-containing protein [Bacteroidia bacterium]